MIIRYAYTHITYYMHAYAVFALVYVCAYADAMCLHVNTVYAYAAVQCACL